MSLAELAGRLVPFLIVFLMILALSFAWTSRIGAPWVPSSKKTVHKMLTLAEVGPDDLVYDLGCGDGRVIIAAARKYGARAVGIEFDPLRYAWCRLLVSVLGLGDRVRVVYGNVFDQDLRDADVIACYLLQKANDRLGEKLIRELRPGTRVVSNTYTFEQFDQVREDGKVRVYLISPDN